MDLIATATPSFSHVWLWLAGAGWICLIILLIKQVMKRRAQPAQPGDTKLDRTDVALLRLAADNLMLFLTKHGRQRDV